MPDSLTGTVWYVNDSFLKSGYPGGYSSKSKETMPSGYTWTTYYTKLSHAWVDANGNTKYSSYQMKSINKPGLLPSVTNEYYCGGTMIAYASYSRGSWSTLWQTSYHLIYISSDTNVPSGVLSYFNSNCTFKGYAITKNLYNATLSNSAWYTNSSYTATVTPSSGYTITSVTVKMNNVDITSTAYSAATKTITISSVTGPITITVYTTNKKYKGILVIKNPYTSVVISKQAPVSPVPPVQPEPEPEPEPYPYSEI